MLGEPTSGRDLLGRDDLLKQLVRHAKKTSAQRRHLALAAPRRCGLTSMMAALAESIGGRGTRIVTLNLNQRSPEDLVECVLEGIAWGLVSNRKAGKETQGEQEEFLELIARLPKKVSDVGREMTELWERWTGRMDETELLERCLQVPGQIQEALGGTLWIFCDGFDRMTAVMGEEFIAGPFRKCLAGNRKVRWVLAGAPPPLMERLVQGPGAVLGGLLELFSFRGVAYSESLKFMARRPASKALPRPYQGFLVALTGSRPFYLDLLTDGLEQTKRDLGRRIGPERLLVETLTRELFAGAGRLNLYFEGLLANTFLGWRAPELYLGMMEAIARGQSSLAGISHFIRREAPALSRQVQNLLDSGLVAKEGTRYYIPDPLFRLWMRYVYLARRAARPRGPTGLPLFQERFRALLKDFRVTFGAERIRRIAQILAVSDGKAARPGALSTNEEPAATVPRFSQVEMQQKLAEETFELIARRDNDYWLFSVFETAPTNAKLSELAERVKRTLGSLPADHTIQPVVIALGKISKPAARTASRLGLTVWDRQDVNRLAECYGQLPIVG